MVASGLKAVIIREGIEAAVLMLYQMLQAIMKELDVKPPPDAPNDTLLPDTTTKED